MELDMSLGDILMKVAMFVLVQALVYLILSNSSDIFSKKKLRSSSSFRPARSVSIRRFFAALSDMPPDGEASPTPKGALQSASQKFFTSDRYES